MPSLVILGIFLRNFLRKIPFASRRCNITLALRIIILTVSHDDGDEKTVGNRFDRIFYTLVRVSNNCREHILWYKYEKILYKSPGQTSAIAFQFNSFNPLWSIIRLNGHHF